jgi:hypothetical protein
MWANEIRRPSWLALVSVVFGLALGATGIARGANPLGWSAPVLVNHQPVLSTRLVAVSCPTVSLCVATDNQGNVVSSTDPTGGYGAWRTVHIDSAETPGSGAATLAVSCPSASLCVAGDDTGNVLTSTHPTSSRAAGWKRVRISATGIGGTDCSEASVCFGVSCPSVSLCVAVNGTGDVITSTDPTAGAGAWHSETVDAGAEFGTVSCPSPSLCLAFDSANRGEVFISTNPAGGAGSWKSTTVGGADVLVSASCPSVSLCVAFDTAGDIVTSTDPTGGDAAWAVSAPPVSLTALSCPTVSLCVAVDSGGTVLTSADPAGGSSTWATTEFANPNAFADVSCPSASLCVAVAFEGDVATSKHPNGGSAAWTSLHVDGGNPLVGVSCASESLCAAVDGFGNVVTSSRPAAGGWTTRDIGDSGVNGVACPSTSLCIAASGGGGVAVSEHPGGQASSWSVSPAVSPDPDGASPVITAVSCASASSCVAVGFYLACDGMPFYCFPVDGWFVATTTDPDAGGAAWRTTRFVTGGPEWDAVSCPTTTFCVAVDSAGNAVTSTNPTGGTYAWTTSNIDGRNTLNGVSCVSRKLCVAVDSAGNELTSTNPTGGPKTWKFGHLSSDEVSGVSCLTTTFCVAVGGSGEAFVSTHPTGGAHDWAATDIDRSGTFNFLSGVSCASVLLCVAIDDAGNAIAGLGPSQAKMKALLSREITPYRGNATNPRLLRDRGYRVPFRALTAGRARIGWYLRPDSAKIKRGTSKAVLIATGHFAFSSAGTAKIKLKITHAATSLFTATRLLRVTAKGTFTPMGSTPVTAISRFILRNAGAS